MNKFIAFFQNYRTAVIWTLRILIGSVFIISGVAKLIDLWGFIYKIEQYLAIWGIPGLRSIVFMIAIGLASFEFIMGLMLTTGSLKRASAWSLLIMMCGMLPLSLYIAITNPVDDCGCFGDFWVISNTGTFLKNVLLTGALVYLVRNNSKAKGIFHRYIQWIQIAFCISYATTFSLIGYNEQPLIDFRDYKIGTPIIGEESGGEMSFIYEKDGETKQFGIESLPDSTWTFVGRIETSTSKSSGIIIADDEGEEITADIIADSGEQLILLIPEIDRADISYTYFIYEINQSINRRGGNMIGLLGTNEHGVNYWKDISMADYEIYPIEDTAIKEIARGNISLVYLNDGIIQWKRTLSSIDPSLFIDSDNDSAFQSLYIDGAKKFWSITGWHLAAMAILLAIDSFILIVRRYLFRKKGKRM